jgi:hypothetical protein
MKTVPSKHRFSFSKPSCPYCGGKLVAEVDEWTQEADGSWAAQTLDITCMSEPDIDGDEWEGWWAGHSMDYCKDWHDLHDRLIAYLKRTTRFEMPASPSSSAPE